MITAIVGLLGALLAAYRDDLSALVGHKPRRVQPKWKGQATEESPSTDRQEEYEIRMQVKQRLRWLSGTFDGEDKAGQNLALKFRGRFNTDDFLSLTFESSDKTRRDFGVILLQLSDDGQELTGYGVANDSKGFAVFLVELKAVKS